MLLNLGRRWELNAQREGDQITAPKELNPPNKREIGDRENKVVLEVK